MAATFSWQHIYGTAAGTGGTASVNYGTGNVVNFFGGTSDTDTAVRAAATGTANYNHTASNIQAGSNSWPILLRARFQTSTNATFNNIKFWRYTTSFDNNTDSMNIVAKAQSSYSECTARSQATATNQAGTAACPTSNSSTSAPTNAISLGSTSTSDAGTCYSPSYICYALTTATNAPAGDTGLAGFTLQYDES